MRRRAFAVYGTESRGRGFAGFAAAAALLLAPVAEAVTVHTWIDTDGVRHFADVPPLAAVADAGRIEIPDSSPAEVAAHDDYYSIVNQWRRIREERKDRDAVRLERERLEADARALAVSRRDEPPYPPGYRVYPAYSPYAFGGDFGYGGRPGFNGFHARGVPGFAARRRNAFVHATPRAWPRLMFFRR